MFPIRDLQSQVSMNTSHRHCIWIMRQIRAIAVLWMTTWIKLIKMTCVMFWWSDSLVEEEISPQATKSQTWPLQHAETLRHMAWCHHTEPRPVSCAVVSVWLICNKTWHFKSPTCATSDNKPPLRSLCKPVDSAAPDDSVFLSRLRAEPASSLDITLILQNKMFLHLCSLSFLSFPVLGSSAGGIFASAYLQRHHHGTCVMPGDLL